MICFVANRIGFHNPRCSLHCTERALAVNVPSSGRPASTNIVIQSDRYFLFSALSFHLKSDNETFIWDGVWLSLRLSMSATWHLGSEEIFLLLFLAIVFKDYRFNKMVKRDVESKSLWSCKIDDSYPRLCLMHHGNIQQKQRTCLYSWGLKKHKSGNNAFIRNVVWLSATSRLGWFSKDFFLIHILLIVKHLAECEFWIIPLCVMHNGIIQQKHILFFYSQISKK